METWREELEWERRIEGRDKEELREGGGMEGTTTSPAVFVVSLTAHLIIILMTLPLSLQVSCPVDYTIDRRRLCVSLGPLCFSMMLRTRCCSASLLKFRLYHTSEDLVIKT